MWRVRPYRSVYSVWFEGNLPHVQLISTLGGKKDEILSPSINKACFIETVIFHYSTWLHIPHTQHNIQDQVERKKWNMEQVWYENGNRSPLDKHNTHTIKPFDKSSMPWSSVKVIKCVVFFFHFGPVYLHYKLFAARQKALYSKFPWKLFKKYFFTMNQWWKHLLRWHKNQHWSYP